MITPQESYPNLAKSLGLNSIVLKREDLHPYGSHKGRSIPVMIDRYIAQGIRHFAVSSSGNSALAAGLHVHKLNKDYKINDMSKYPIELEIFVGKNIRPHKLEKLQKLQTDHVLISIQERPLQALFLRTQDDKIQGLRQSTDDSALIGYSELAEELLQIPDLKAVFMGSSSGTTAQALAQFFIDAGKNIEVHIVQTSSCHPIADSFVDNEGNDTKSIADAIVDHVAARKDKIVSLIEKDGGSGWLALNEQIGSAMEMTKTHTGLSISPNSALSVAGVMEASYTGKTWDGTVVCLICGE